jgi:hypothetical protein
MVLALIVGYCIGTALAYLLCKWLLRALARRLSADERQQHWIVRVGSIFGAMSLAPAIFLAVMAGGVVGRDYPVVIAGIAAITVVTVTSTAALGAGMGALLGRGIFADREMRRN